MRVAIYSFALGLLVATLMFLIAGAIKRVEKFDGGTVVSTTAIPTNSSSTPTLTAAQITAAINNSNTPDTAPTTAPTTTPTTAPTTTPVTTPVTAPTITPTSTPVTAPTSTPATTPTSTPVAGQSVATVSQSTSVPVVNTVPVIDSTAVPAVPVAGLAATHPATSNPTQLYTPPAATLTNSTTSKDTFTSLTPKEKELFQDIKNNKFNNKQIEALINSGIINNHLFEKFLNVLGNQEKSKTKGKPVTEEKIEPFVGSQYAVWA